MPALAHSCLPLTQRYPAADASDDTILSACRRGDCAPDVVLSDGWLVTFFRSFLLLQLLAFLRLAVFVIPQQAKLPRVNRGIRGVRGFLRGAPLILAFAFCIPVAGAVLTGSADVGGSGWGGSFEHADDGNIAGTDCGVGVSPLHACAPLEPHAAALPGEKHNVAELPEDRLYLQRLDRKMSLPLNQVHGVSDLLNQAEEQLEVFGTAWTSLNAVLACTSLSPKLRPAAGRLLEVARDIKEPSATCRVESMPSGVATPGVKMRAPWGHSRPRASRTSDSRRTGSTKSSQNLGGSSEL